MTEIGFTPLTSQLGVPGTSYRLQLGLINEKWAVRMLKGKNIIDSYVFKDEDVEGDFPNQNLIVGWVLRTVAIPNINPHQVMKTTQALVKQALQKREERKVKAPISETKEVELEKVPESELKRPKVQGWVKTEGTKTQEELEEERRQAFKARVAARKTDAQTSGSTLKTTRQLPSIPKEGAEVKESVSKEGEFCPYCGKDLGFRFCPFCGKPLPHD
ncbi:MAG: zinc ribbon domain-containing protein [Candidatus Lokiarchaeota archaeon]|nr:zinc ribbon domain-containing protein [Candidatus Lokiarchaeota archaeon]